MQEILEHNFQTSPSNDILHGTNHGPFHILHNSTLFQSPSKCLGHNLLLQKRLFADNIHNQNYGPILNKKLLYWHIKTTTKPTIYVLVLSVCYHYQMLVEFPSVSLLLQLHFANTYINMVSILDQIRQQILHCSNTLDTPQIWVQSLHPCFVGFFKHFLHFNLITPKILLSRHFHRGQCHSIQCILFSNMFLTIYSSCYLHHHFHWSCSCQAVPKLHASFSCISRPFFWSVLKSLSSQLSIFDSTTSTAYVSVTSSAAAATSLFV